MDNKDTITTGRQASCRFLSVELCGQPRLLASVRLRMPSGLEADLPDEFATQPVHHVARITLAIAALATLPTNTRQAMPRQPPL